MQDLISSFSSFFFFWQVAWTKTHKFEDLNEHSREYMIIDFSEVLLSFIPFILMIFFLFQLKILGKAFGIPEENVRTYTEAEIRAG
jgi:hypothetical protein